MTEDLLNWNFEQHAALTGHLKFYDMNLRQVWSVDDELLKTNNDLSYLRHTDDTLHRYATERKYVTTMLAIRHYCESSGNQKEVIRDLVYLFTGRPGLVALDNYVAHFTEHYKHLL